MRHSGVSAAPLVEEYTTGLKQTTVDLCYEGHDEPI